MLDIQRDAGDTTPNKNEEWWQPTSQSVLTTFGLGRDFHFDKTA